MKTLLVIENDPSLDTLTENFVSKFKRYNDNSEVIIFTNFRQKSKKELVDTITQCTDIFCRTSLISGSEYQLKDMAKLLANFEDSKNIMIFSSDLESSINDILDDKEIFDIKHHIIFDQIENKRLYFYDAIKRVEKELLYQKDSTQRAIGKVKILECNGFGPQFENLPIGEVVDILDMSDIDPSPNKGVWVMGNGEPVKLINDYRFREYELISDNTYDKIIAFSGANNVHKSIRLAIEDVISNPNNYVNAGNEICDLLGIPRRGNRNNINSLIRENGK